MQGMIFSAPTQPQRGNEPPCAPTSCTADSLHAVHPFSGSGLSAPPATHTRLGRHDSICCRSAELLSSVFHSMHGLPITTLRVFTVYGPRCARPCSRTRSETLPQETLHAGFCA